MSHLVAEFYFESSQIAVNQDILGQAIRFKRGRYDCEISCPAGADDFPKNSLFTELEINLKTEIGLLPAIRVKLRFDSDIPPATAESRAQRNDQTAQKLLDEAFIEARSIVSEFVTRIRLRGQVWLDSHPASLYLSKPSMLGDEDTKAELASASKSAPLPIVNREGAIDKAFFADIPDLLGDNRSVCPLSHTLLADARQLADDVPPDLDKAVLIAAIACETEVKRTLRDFCSSEVRPMIDLILDNPRDWSISALVLFDRAMKAALDVSLKELDKPLFKKVQTLFEHRNAIAHSKSKRATADELRDSIGTAQSVLRWLEEVQKPTTRNLK